MIYLTLTIGPGPALTTVAAVEETKNIFFEGREWLVRNLRNQPVYRPQHRLRVVDVARFPFAGSLAPLANPVSRAVLNLQDKLDDEGGLRVLGECSDYVHGRGVRDFLVRLRTALMGDVYSAPVEVVTTDLPRATPEGWRVKVPRRDVVHELSERSGDGRLLLDVRGPLARELGTQLAEMTQKPQRAADEVAPIEDLALGVALVCYAQTNRPQAGYVGDISFPKEAEPETPMRRSEKLGYYKKS